MINFAGIGKQRMPEANKRQYTGLVTGSGKFYGYTCYGDMFTNSTTENTRELYRLERQKLKERKAQHTKGSLSPSKKLPLISK